MSINYLPSGTRAGFPSAQRVLPPVDDHGVIFCRYVRANGIPCGTEVADPYGAILLCVHHLAEAVSMVKDALSVPISTPESNARYARRVAARQQTMLDQSVVYYVRIGKVIKIGTTINLKQRLGDFRLDASDGELLATEPGNRVLEQRRHKQFAHLRIGRREHFQETQELREHIERILEEHGQPVITTYPKAEKRRA